MRTRRNRQPNPASQITPPPQTKKIKTGHSAERTNATGDSRVATFGEAGSGLLELPSELRLMIWRDLVFLEHEKVRPRQIYRSARPLKGPSRATAFKTQRRLRCIVNEEDPSVPRSWESDLRKRKRMDPLWAAFVCRQMYNEITPLYYSHVHYSLYCNIGLVCLRQRNLLEVLSRTFGSQFIGFIGVHNAQFIQHLTLTCGEFGDLDEYYNHAYALTMLTLPHWSALAFIHLLATNVQSIFPHRPIIHCNTRIASAVFKLTVHPDQRLSGSIWHRHQGWKAEILSSMFQTLDILHILSKPDDFRGLSRAFDKLFHTFVDEGAGGRHSSFTREEWMNFLVDKTRQLLKGDELTQIHALHPPMGPTTKETACIEEESAEERIPATKVDDHVDSNFGESMCMPQRIGPTFLQWIWGLLPHR